MRQVKFFKCLEFEFPELEAKVNLWIHDSGVSVIDVKVQLAPQTGLRGRESSVGMAPEQSDLVCMVIYDSK